MKDYSTQFIHISIQCASIALLYYDYVLTFSLEVRYIWKQKIGLSTILYIFCRYALIANIIYLLSILNKLMTSCNFAYKIAASLGVLGRFGIIVVWSARAYACNRSRIVLVFFVILGSVIIILSIIRIPFYQCKRDTTVPHVNDIILALMCVFETSSAIITTYIGIQALNVGGPGRTSRNGMMFVVLEQGVVYVCASSLCTIVSLIIRFEFSV